MFQTFTSNTTPTTCAARLSALRNVLDAQGLAGFLVPRSDQHQGEYVAPRDERLAWLTSFTGSAGTAGVLATRAALFVDGRYSLQAPMQTDAALYELFQTPVQTLSAWLNEYAPKNAVLGFDPWLYSIDQYDRLKADLRDDITLRAIDNPIDALWDDQPDMPLDPIVIYPLRYAGRDMVDKLADLSANLSAKKEQAVVLTLPDTIAWLLNIRGGDLARTPVALANAIAYQDGSVDLFTPLSKVGDELRDYFGERVRCFAPYQFTIRLSALSGRIRLTPSTCPVAVERALVAKGVYGDDLIVQAKACKNETEQDGARDAHYRDGVAVVKLLSWLARQDVAHLDEISIVKQLETYRREDETLKNIAFETICGVGANGAIVHYRVTEESNRQLRDGDVLLLDSGGQYLSGTTDLTRTIGFGDVDTRAKEAFTLVLKGMIALSALRFVAGCAGRDIDAIARQFLWAHGMDYDHGTGHGVGAFLGVHEGPASISPRSNVPLRAGMILSNEPGYYVQGQFGIRIENLLLVKEVTAEKNRTMLGFETLTLVPIDRTMIVSDMLTADERAWLNDYHSKLYAELSPSLDKQVAQWLKQTCAPI